MCDDATRPRGWLPVAALSGVGPVLGVCVDAAPDAAPDAAHSRDATGVVWTSHDPIHQQAAPFETVVLGSCVGGAPPEVRRAAVHQAVQHLRPHGRLAVPAGVWHVVEALCLDVGLTIEADDPSGGRAGGDVVVVRRTGRLCVHDLMWEARAQIRRVDAMQLCVELGGPDAPVVVDTRAHTDRCRTGVIAGSIHVPRTVVEWHLDPANGYRHPAVRGFDQPLVLVCNGGYSSSLAAANLQRLGFTNVRDLVGGMRAWVRHGLAVDAPDHAHLDL